VLLALLRNAADGANLLPVCMLLLGRASIGVGETVQQQQGQSQATKLVPSAVNHETGTIPAPVVAMGSQVTCSPADRLEADNSTGLMSRATVATTAAAELASW
jgi:hypothetical protein